MSTESNNFEPSVNNISPSTISETFRCDVFCARVFKEIHKFYENNIFCDVILTSKDGEYKINAHKMVLSAASTYFRAMFGGSFQEATDKEVKLHQIDSHSLKLVINYIYTGTIKFTIATIREILETAHLFDLEPLKAQCGDFMVKTLNVNNCLDVALTADHYNLDRLFEIAENYVCHNFAMVRNREEFFDLNVDTLKKFISSSKLQVKLEEEVFECIKSWVDHDIENRKKYYDTLLHNVRLPLVSPLFTANVIQPVCDSMECQRIINKAFKWHLLPELRSSLFPEELTQPRYSKRTLIAISGWEAETYLTGLAVGKYSFELNNWTYEAWPAVPGGYRAKFNYSVMNEMLVISGGYTRANHLANSDMCLDLKNITWVSPSPYSLSPDPKSFGLVTSNGCLYSFDHAAPNVGRFAKWDPSTGLWQNFSETITGIGQNDPRIFLAHCHNKMFVLAEDNIIKRIFIYDEVWKTQLGLYDISRTLGVGTVRSRDKELVIVVCEQSIIKYDLINDKKVIITPTKRIGNEYKSCAMFDDYVVIFGDTQFQVYYPFTDVWKTLPPLENIHGRVVLI